MLAAQQAGIDAVRPGAEFLDPNTAAMKVLAQGLFDLGILDGRPRRGHAHRAAAARAATRCTASRTCSGIDVHDCAHARETSYCKGTLEVGYVLTVEPGLYFQPDDLTVPEQYRGIGVRIEDDVLVTERRVPRALRRPPAASPTRSRPGWPSCSRARRRSLGL